MEKRKKNNSSSLATRSGKSGVVRICAGRWKRTPLSVLDLEGLRPTGSRIRETVFDWLNFLLPGFTGRRSLDLFAGSGAMGFEFASRGGRSVLIEKDRRNASGLRTVVEKLKAGEDAEVIQGDCIAVAPRLPAGQFDVIFIDPPFAAGLHLKALEAADRLLAPEGLIYFETPVEGDAIPVPEAFAVLREGTAGAVRYRILARRSSARFAESIG